MTIVAGLTHRPSKPLNIAPCRSADVFSDWLKDHPDTFHAGIDHVAMDAFARYKKTATEMVPDATTVMDLFHVVALAGTTLEETKRRLQAEQTGRRGRAGDDPYRNRKTIRIRADLLTDIQK